MGYFSGGKESSKSANIAMAYKWADLEKQLVSDPLLSQAYGQAAGFLDQVDIPDYDWVGMMKGTGAAAADKQTQAITSALAGRGGGNLASALEMGAQARSGTMLDAISKGAGLQMGQTQMQSGLYTQAIGNLLSTMQAKFGGLSQIYGGVGAQTSDYTKAMTSWDVGLMNMLGQMINVNLGSKP